MRILRLASLLVNTRSNRRAPISTTRMGTEQREAVRQAAQDRMSREQYEICFRGGTERAFTGSLWDHHGRGKYVCAACQAPLFSSTTKFDSGTGWPSFWAATEGTAVEERRDTSGGMQRIEVLCAHCGCHLGHRFNDGPPPTHQRFCVNSASLNFQPAREES